MSEQLKALAAERMARYALRRERGQCVRCPKPSPSSVLCDACKERDRVDSKRRRERANLSRSLLRFVRAVRADSSAYQWHKAADAVLAEAEGR